MYLFTILDTLRNGKCIDLYFYGKYFPRPKSSVANFKVSHNVLSGTKFMMLTTA